MSVPPCDEPETAKNATTARNRLSIRHLMLWMATTGVALTLLQVHKPPPPQNIGFASFLHSSGSTAEEVEAAMNKRRKELWLVWQRQYLIALTFAPVYGAALAGLALALWRTITLQFGFPAQPGHWLLIIVVGLAMPFFARPYLQMKAIGYGTPFGQDAPDFFLAAIATAISAVATIFARQPLHWRIAFLALCVFQAMQAVAYVGLIFTSQPEAFAPLGIGLWGAQLWPFLSPFSAFFDIADCNRFDILHWIGFAVLIGVDLHSLALIAAQVFAN